jgi:predicted Fe-S protein YdhL (DUF1289 family)
MTTLREAAEMALKALSEYTGVVTSGTDPNKWHEVVDGGGPAREAIEALRQALAQPEQEPYPEGDIVGPCICGSWPGGECLKCKRIEQPKREWVGMTEDETDGLIHSATYMDETDIWHLVSLVEERLKEKNT